MKKLLHERSMEMKEEMIIGTCSSIVKIFDMDCSEYIDCDVCVKEFFSRLADEIERYYIPRPRFEDGEPVYRGDDIEVEGITSKVDGIRVVADKQDSDETMFYLHNGIMLGRATSIPAKHPQPKVLDADGVEIKVGDTVWSIPSGKKYIVNDVSEYVCTTTDGAVPHPSMLTHKEPDSLEKLRDDMALDASADGSAISSSRLGVYATRLSALIERGA